MGSGLEARSERLENERVADVSAQWSTDWAEVRDRWNLFNAVRTALNVVAFVCLLLAATSPRTVTKSV
ncbi:MAG TPA: DUF1772 domain-containing protein [Jiangellaceae bacterium]